MMTKALQEEIREQMRELLVEANEAVVDVLCVADSSDHYRLVAAYMQAWATTAAAMKHEE